MSTFYTYSFKEKEKTKTLKSNYLINNLDTHYQSVCVCVCVSVCIFFIKCLFERKKNNYKSKQIFKKEN